MKIACITFTHFIWNIHRTSTIEKELTIQCFNLTQWWKSNLCLKGNININWTCILIAEFWIKMVNLHVDMICKQKKSEKIFKKCKKQCISPKNQREWTAKQTCNSRVSSKIRETSYHDCLKPQTTILMLYYASYFTTSHVKIAVNEIYHNQRSTLYLARTECFCDVITMSSSRVKIQRTGWPHL